MFCSIKNLRYFKIFPSENPKKMNIFILIFVQSFVNGFDSFFMEISNCLRDFWGNTLFLGTYREVVINKLWIPLNISRLRLNL